LGKEEALLVATACSGPPTGRARWTLELLADELARLTEHPSISRENGAAALAENQLKPWRQEMWCIPQVDGEYVARMEDVLDLYAEVYDPNGRALMRAPPQLIGEVRQPIRAKPVCWIGWSSTMSPSGKLAYIAPLFTEEFHLLARPATWVAAIWSRRAMAPAPIGGRGRDLPCGRGGDLRRDG
jgi:hypothetical protein